MSQGRGGSMHLVVIVAVGIAVRHTRYTWAP
jgi:hypothetical protein